MNNRPNSNDSKDSSTSPPAARPARGPPPPMTLVDLLMRGMEDLQSGSTSSDSVQRYLAISSSISPEERERFRRQLLTRQHQPPSSVSTATESQSGPIPRDPDEDQDNGDDSATPPKQ